MPSSAQLLQIISIQTEVARLGPDLGAVMQYVVEQILSLIDADGAACELAEGNQMVYRAASGIARAQLGLRLDMNKSLSGQSVQSQQPLYCHDSETDPRVDREATRRVGLRSMIVMPLKHQNSVVGVLKAMSKVPSKFGDGDIKLLELLCDLVGSVIFFTVKYDTDALFVRATHDALTGIANRSLFMDRLRNIATCAARSQEASAVLIIDLDEFKQVNDNFGHRTGDAVLVEFAHRLKAISRTSDTVARLGGDEFGVLLSPLGESAGVREYMRRIAVEVELPFAFEGQKIAIRASAGHAMFPDDGNNPDALIAIADKRMYEFKAVRKKQGA